jgi:hypothetical protein
LGRGGDIAVAGMVGAPSPAGRAKPVPARLDAP